MTDLQFEQRLITALTSKTKRLDYGATQRLLDKHNLAKTLQQLHNHHWFSESEYLEHLHCLQSVFEHCQQHLQPQFLVGPTGESNQLVYINKGLCWIDYQPECDFNKLFLFICSVLLTGNSMLINSHNDTVKQFVKIHNKHNNEGMLNLVDPQYSNLLLNHPALDMVICCADKKMTKQINQLLAERDGPIVTLISFNADADVMQIDCLALLLRCTHERCICDNISAFGGNTQLLSLTN